MWSLRPVALLLVAATLAGCSSGEAFVDRNYMTKTIKKQKLPGWDGQVPVCFSSDTPRETRDQLAREACEVYGLEAKLLRVERWQCRFTVPHMASYICFDPDMRFANGALVNPFSAGQVDMWQRQQARIKAGIPPEDGDEAAPPR